MLDKELLLIDIGGTNIRTAFAVAGSKEVRGASKQSLDSLNNLNAMIESLLADRPIRPTAIVLSVAGPKYGNTIKMTNRDFSICADDVKKDFNLDHCYLLNDWESIGHSLALANSSDIHSIHKGTQFNSTALMVGPGTGLGAALVIDERIVLPTELGNTTYLLQGLLDQINIPHTSKFNVLEDLVSGTGISNLYLHHSSESLSGEVIIKRYYDNEAIAIQVVKQYLESLAALLSDLALMYLPGNGIYLAGGFIRALKPLIDSESFIKTFTSNRKPMHQELLEKTSIGIIEKEMTCLYGNLNYFNTIYFQQDS